MNWLEDAAAGIGLVTFFVAAFVLCIGFGG